MALTERQEIGKIEVVGPWKHIQVREDTVIERDGDEISRSYHRYVVAPGDDHEGLPADVRSVAEALHTSEHNQAYLNYLEAQQEL